MPEWTALGASRERSRRACRVGLLMAAIVGLAIFLVDLLSPLRGAIAVLYVAVPLLLAPLYERRIVIGSALLCALLTLAAYFSGHWGERPDDAFSRCAVSLVAILVTTTLALRDRSARAALAEQVRVLELSHDTVIIRDRDDIIRYWNDGAEQLYGYTRDEAIGMKCDALLRCAYPSAEAAASIAQDGQWSGEVVRTCRAGRRLVLESRWLQRRDARGKPIGIVETSANVTLHKQADEERERSERRYRAIFHAAGFATWESDWSKIRDAVVEATAGIDGDLAAWLKDRPDIVRAAAGKAMIREVNDAAVALFEAQGPRDLVGTSIIGRYPPGGEAGFARLLAGLAGGTEVVEAETQLSTLTGKTIDVVLRATFVADGTPWSRVLVMAFDETERKQERAKLALVSAELAHAARVSTLGQLAASIAHEVNQPLTAIVTFGKSGKRWLGRDVPDIGEATQCLDHIVANGSRAADIISRVRGLARKTAPQTEKLDIPLLVDEAASLVHREAARAGVTLERVSAPDLPYGLGDRVQVQQVIMNLLMNGIQAMQTIEDRQRELRISLVTEASGLIRVTVSDCGSGIAEEDPMSIFKPFYTTKSEGMGMGLSICRSIVEAQGGKMFATNNPLHGASIGFTIPAHWSEAVDAGD